MSFRAEESIYACASYDHCCHLEGLVTPAACVLIGATFACHHGTATMRVVLTGRQVSQ